MSKLVFFFLVFMWKFVLEYGCFPFVKRDLFTKQNNKYQNRLQQLQWKEQRKKEDHVKDGGTRLKRI